MSPRRRRVTALAAATVLCATAAPVASAATPDGAAHTAARTTSAAAAAQRAALPKGLYGDGDPRYDGVWRQSMALLALHGAGAVPAKKAVDWLTDQQCADGSFTAYRADTGKPCDPAKAPSDINATTLAVQALSAVGGRSETVGKAVDWIASVQNKDGGWGYSPGADSDANSTSLVIGALDAAGRNPAKTTKNGKSPYDALASFQLTCGAKGIEDAPGGQGAFAYQPDKKGRLSPNNDATAAASLAALGKGVLVRPLDRDAKSIPVSPLKCASTGGGDNSDDKTGDKTDDGGNGSGDGRDSGGRSALDDPKDAAAAGAAYLARTLEKDKGRFTVVTPSSDEEKPDYANTADAVIALAAGGHRTEADASLKWLADHLDDWDKAKNDPSAISALMLASRATGHDAAELGGTDLLERLTASGPAPAHMPDSDKDSSAKDDGGTFPVWAFILIGLAVGAGIGIFLSGQRKRQQL
ncbi:prenyltransferase/squalene oxidase repeat-containing protein [Streptomyces cacaoi]|uniref:prenyltransferase/squalene oxidase repeat-containing protein n=1 Tax=Streptomyces cacaoi TaxID=1898 RepID=UPI0011F1F30C|nr:prenyltransferase/squalene oxidase repeat-containing protein [Streptomyces cacaoi]